MKERPSRSEAFAALRRAAATVSARVQDRLASHGLIASRFATLCALRAGPLCPHDIAGRLCQTRGNVTMILDDLEQRGLVERRQEGVNRRYRAVHLTPRGRRLAASLAPRHREAVEEEMNLTDRETALLLKLCRKLASSPE